MKMKSIESACWAKFSQNIFLADVIGDQTLVEASPYDDFWGGSCPKEVPDGDAKCYVVRHE